ncbi:hypothetical protein [Streptococcus sciuri]|uniref:Uncharacterized protein n=1 Tax=Streptococcus sciuri TaxID=2973939 RepID=A0ABT2F5M8_9STRE|nr:hypothetical protein [Streptococcus sciuri]MCS4487717.1 hypothetical protein [Streptococcus sciuri]
MGKVIFKDIFGDGFRYCYDDGKQEHFVSSLFGDSYRGDKGSRIEPAFLGGYKVTRYDGHMETARI